MVGDFFTPDLDTGTMPFPGSTDETHFSTAWWMAKFSELAYEDQNTIADELDAIKNIDCDYFVFFENQDTEAYIARFTQGFAVLAFRGTEKDYFDIVTDISALMRPIGSATGAKVHGGFLTGFQNVWGTFAPRKYQEYQKYQENQESETPHEMEIRVEGRPKGIANILSDFGFCGSDELDLYITGHSLGGALASIAGYYLSDSKAFYSEQLNIAGVYTFGAPRLFDKKAEQRFQESDIDCHRFIYDADIVAQLPPSMPGLLEYHHTRKHLSTIEIIEEIEEIKDIESRIRGYKDLDSNPGRDEEKIDYGYLTEKEFQDITSRIDTFKQHIAVIDTYIQKLKNLDAKQGIQEITKKAGNRKQELAAVFEFLANEKRGTFASRIDEFKKFITEFDAHIEKLKNLDAKQDKEGAITESYEHNRNDLIIMFEEVIELLKKYRNYRLLQAIDYQEKRKKRVIENFNAKKQSQEHKLSLSDSYIETTQTFKRNIRSFAWLALHFLLGARGALLGVTIGAVAALMIGIPEGIDWGLEFAKTLPLNLSESMEIFSGVIIGSTTGIAISLPPGALIGAIVGYFVMGGLFKKRIKDHLSKDNRSNWIISVLLATIVAFIVVILELILTTGLLVDAGIIVMLAISSSIIYKLVENPWRKWIIVGFLILVVGSVIAIPMLLILIVALLETLLMILAVVIIAMLWAYRLRAVIGKDIRQNPHGTKHHMLMGYIYALEKFYRDEANV